MPLRISQPSTLANRTPAIDAASDLVIRPCRNKRMSWSRSRGLQ